jgi:hypothetical protein
MSINVVKSTENGIRYCISTYEEATPSNRVNDAIEATPSRKLLLRRIRATYTSVPCQPCQATIAFTIENNPEPFVINADLQQPKVTMSYYDFPVEMTQGVVVPAGGALTSCIVELKFGTAAVSKLLEYELVVDVIGNTFKAC